MVKLQGVLKNPNGMYPAISWPDQTGTLANLGDTFKFTPAAGTTGTFDRGTTGGGVFDLLQWHIHTPSEHRINGIDYPAEIHFVHIKDGSKLAVVGGMVEYGTETSPFITSMLNAAKNITVGSKASFTSAYGPVVSAIKNSARFYRYTGSLTTPEGVKWLVAGSPVFTITTSDYETLRNILIYSARNTQPLSNPYDGDWVNKRMSDYFPDGKKNVAAVSSGH